VAKECLQLETKLTAALGKRTKYQREDIAQLYLYAKSNILDHNGKYISYTMLIHVNSCYLIL